MYIKANGINMHYQKTGRGYPVLTIHGNGEDGSIFAPLAALLEDRCAVYAPDSRDHGDSDKTGGELYYSDMAEDISGFIAALNIKKPLLVGSSDGGIISLLIAINSPELISGIVVCGANTKPSGIKLWPRLMMAAEYLAKKDKKIKLMLTQPDITPEALGGITVPSAILAGSEDLIKQRHTEKIAESIPNSKLFILEGETHTSYVTDNPKRLSEIVLEFIDRIEG